MKGIESKYEDSKDGVNRLFYVSLRPCSSSRARPPFASFRSDGRPFHFFLTPLLNPSLAPHLSPSSRPHPIIPCLPSLQMALPPQVFITVAQGLKKNNYTPAPGINRVVVEKPFGKDLDSSREMMKDLKEQFTEDETFRIDHYLGKEMIKNLLVLRFGNMFLDSSFNKNYVSNVQITFKEAIGTEGRGGYFDGVSLGYRTLDETASASFC